jgi:FAD:protein FMN transferase
MVVIAPTAAPVRLAADAMRCRFELVLAGDDPAQLRAAGEEALREIRALDARLNVFSPASELAWVNREAGDAPLRVSPRLFDLLMQACRLWERTGGAFDPTLGPLVRLWRACWASGRLPSPAAVAAVRVQTGMPLVELDPERRTVRFVRPGVELNLNAMAKGYALDEAAAILREAGVGSALLHGGTSSVLGIGSPPDADAWRVGVADPLEPRRMLETLDLCDSALSVSSQHNQAKLVEGRSVGHVIDPRTGEPAAAARVAVVLSPAAAAADALATAWLCAPIAGADWLRPGETGLIVAA